MKVAKKLATFGVAMTTMAAITVAVPATVEAQAPQIAQKQRTVALEEKSNAAVDVTTELNCSTHQLTAKVTNKTDGEISPEVTFNEEEPQFPSLPIKPGETGKYYYAFSGNHVPVEVMVKVDTFEPVKVEPTLHCDEPVTFTATEASESTVVGHLQNNSTLVSQTVYTQGGLGDIRVEHLAPGEGRTVSMPYNGSSEQEVAFVTIATDAGYESSYTVSIGQSIPE